MDGGWDGKESGGDGPRFIVSADRVRVCIPRRGYQVHESGG